VELETRTITELAALDNLEALFAEPLDSSELISANIDHASCKLALFERVMQHYSAELKAVAWKMALPRRLDKAVLTVLFADQADTMREAFVRAGLLPSVRWEEGKLVSLHQEIRDLLLAYAKYKSWLETEETKVLHQQLAELFAQRYQKNADIHLLLERLYHQLMADGNADLSHINQPEFLVDMALAFQAEKQYQKMTQVFLKQIEIQSDFGNAWYGLGIALYHLGKLDEAVIAYQKDCEINQNHTFAWHNLGYALYQLGRLNEAITAFQKLTYLQPNNESAWNCLGQALSDLGKQNEAIVAYKKACEINPNNEDSWHYLGNILYESKKFDEAINAYKKSCEINPSYDYIWNNLGVMYRMQGNFEQAQQAFAKALEINPNDIFLLNNDVRLALIQQDKNRCLQRIQQALPLVDNKTDIFAILPFLAWLIEPENSQVGRVSL
jgi:tetratricopeptide (TPR) repeat protein